MLCVSCKSEISSNFKHAISKNECPFCGGAIFDEEILALVDDLKKTINDEVKLREETVQKLAMAIAVKYNLSTQERTTERQPEKKVESVEKQEVEDDEKNIKIASSSYKNISANVIKATDIEQGSELPEIDRIKIMEEVAKERYHLVDQVTDVSFDTSEASYDVPVGLVDNGLDPVLEQERVARLRIQQQAMNGNKKSAFRRG